MAQEKESQISRVICNRQGQKIKSKKTCIQSGANIVTYMYSKESLVLGASSIFFIVGALKKNKK